MFSPGNATLGIQWLRAIRSWSWQKFAIAALVGTAILAVVIGLCLLDARYR